MIANLVRYHARCYASTMPPATALLIGALLVGQVSPLPEADAVSPRPNIVLVLSDDQGLGDFSHAGHAALETPNLDRLAAECPRVERFYVSPVCSPTRASLMTGRYNYRTRVVDTWIGRSMMEPDEQTLAEVLRAAGYATGIFGKWHLGDCYPLRPMEQGFEEALVLRGGGLAQPSEPPANRGRYSDPILIHNGVETATSGYCTDVYFDAALAFVDASLERGRPFFAYVATNTPHGPYDDVPIELYEKYKARDLAAQLGADSRQLDREARICAMLENLDQNVGRLLAHLERRGLVEDTIVVFLSDNGPVPGRFSAGLRGAKAEVYEGGIRAPLFVRWPGRLAPTTTVRPIVAHIDLLPTLLEMTGVEPRAALALDGRSLWPLLAGLPTDWPERRLVLQSHRGNEPQREHQFALVGQRWKLVRASGFGRHAPQPDAAFELFDLLADPAEQRDLAAREPERVAELRRAYGAWFDDVASTRADNWLPPRILVGSERAPRTLLTRQDRRSEEGEGWGNDGSWWLEAEAACALEVELLFTRPTAVAEARLFVDDELTTCALAESGERIALGRLSVPAGPFLLRVELSAGGAELDVHQLVLRAVR